MNETFYFFHHRVTDGRELIAIGAFTLAVTILPLYWAFGDRRKIKSWQRFIQTGSLKFALIAVVMLWFSWDWISAGIKALH